MKALRIKQTRFRMPRARTGLRRIRKASALIRHHHDAYHTRIISNRDIFLSLYRLGSDSVQKFEEPRRLRSHVVPLQAIYLRCRLVVIIDEPFRARAISQLRLILEFRKGRKGVAYVVQQVETARSCTLRTDVLDAASASFASSCFAV